MKIYILSILSVKQKTEEMLKKELEIHNLKYNKNLTMDKYINFINSFNPYASKYTDSYGEPNAYFFNLSDAIYAAEHNLGDINEAGVYNYITIVALPIGQMYAHIEPSEFYVFKYNEKEDGYIQITNNDDEIYKFLAKSHNATYLIKEKPIINMNLSKEEEKNTKDFINTLKENIDKKEYNKVKELIENKEVSVSNKLNDFFKDMTDSFKQVDETVNRFFDILNGK